MHNSKAAHVCAAWPLMAGAAPEWRDDLAARRAAPRPRIRSLGQAFDLACKELSLDPRPALVAAEQVRSRHRAIPIDRVNAHQHSVRYVSKFSGARRAPIVNELPKQPQEEQ